MDGRVVSKTEFGSPIPFRDVMPADKTTHNTHSNEKTTKLLEIPGSRPTWLLVNNMNDPLDYTTKSSRLSTQPAKQPLTPAQRRAIGERNKAADDQARAAARVWNAIKGFPEFINYSPINLEMRAARLKAEAEAKQNEQADGKSTSTENPKPGDLGKKGEAGAMESALKLDLTPIPAAEDVMMVGQSKEVMVVPEANTPLQSPLLEETKARESHRFPKQLLEDRVRRASGQGAHLEETPRPMLETPAKLNGKRLGDGPKVPSTPRQNSNIETPRLPTEAPEPFHTHTFTDKSGNQEHSVDDTNKDEISSKGSSDQHSKSNDDDDIASVSTEDPVTMAIRATLTVSDEEDDGFEEGSIIYPRDSWTGCVSDQFLNLQTHVCLAWMNFIAHLNHLQQHTSPGLSLPPHFVKFLPACMSQYSPPLLMLLRTKPWCIKMCLDPQTLSIGLPHCSSNLTYFRPLKIDLFHPLKILRNGRRSNYPIRGHILPSICIPLTNNLSINMAFRIL